jgi:hypothetical protein
VFSDANGEFQLYSAGSLRFRASSHPERQLGALYDPAREALRVHVRGQRFHDGRHAAAQ